MRSFSQSTQAVVAKYHKYIIGGILTMFLFVAFSQWSQQHAEVLKEITSQAGIVGVGSYVVILAGSIIFAPLSTGFLLPVAANSYGPALAAIYSIFGWTIGSMVAFWLARRFGHGRIKESSLILRIQSYETAISPYHFYGMLILLRMALPVDILSYALGLVSKIRYTPFLITTVLGIAPFAFVFTFASLESVWIQLLTSIFATLLFSTVAYWVYRESVQSAPKE